MFEIGNSLREARVRQGLDYPQVELATKIRAKYVRALEDEQFAVLPAQPYVKGFLRTYADFLGLDGQLYVDEFNSRFVVDGLDDPPLRRVSPRPRQQRGVERKVVFLALAVIAALTALVIVAWKFGGGNAAAPPAPAQAAPRVPSELQLKGVGPGTYVEVRRGSARGVVLLQATVAGGTVERVNGSRFWLYVKRPSALVVRLAGKPVALPARRNLKVVVTPSRTALAAG
ncbi:MAG TPA: helix-turn-helix domain-containing protein [Gaiellaceae bacterium]